MSRGPVTRFYRYVVRPPGILLSISPPTCPFDLIFVLIDVPHAVSVDPAENLFGRIWILKCRKPVFWAQCATLQSM